MKTVFTALTVLGLMISSAQAAKTENSWVCSSACSVANPIPSSKVINQGRVVETPAVKIPLEGSKARDKSASSETISAGGCSAAGPSAKQAVEALVAKLDTGVDCKTCKSFDIEKANCLNVMSGQSYAYSTLKSRLGIGANGEKGASVEGKKAD